MTPWKPSRPSSPVRRWPPTPKLMLRAFAAIALCYSRMGRAEMSYNLLSDTLRQSRAPPFLPLSYNYLWILELAVFYAEHGFPPARHRSRYPVPARPRSARAP